MVFELTSLAFFFAALSSVFTIVNPISTATIFVSITKGDTRKKKLQMAKKASITAAIVLIIFAFVGNFILGFFNITVEAFRIAGGILIVRVGLNMLNSKETELSSEVERKEAIKKDDISIIPLAIPMLSGPGAMTTAIVLMSEAGSIFEVLFLVLAILIVCFMSYLILAEADLIQKYLGENGKKVVEKIMGLIVLVVGIQFIINGVGGLLTTWNFV